MIPISATVGDIRKLTSLGFSKTQTVIVPPRATVECKFPTKKVGGKVSNENWSPEGKDGSHGVESEVFLGQWVAF